VRVVRLKSFIHVLELGGFTVGGRAGFGRVVRLEWPFEGITGVVHQVRDGLDVRFSTGSDIIPARARA